MKGAGGGREAKKVMEVEDAEKLGTTVGIYAEMAYHGYRPDFLSYPFAFFPFFPSFP